MGGKKGVGRRDLFKEIPLLGESQKCGLTFGANQGWRSFPHKVMVALTMSSGGTSSQHWLNPCRPAVPPLGGLTERFAAAARWLTHAQVGT